MQLFAIECLRIQKAKKEEEMAKKSNFYKGEQE
jgi:hypothetical protein